ncbi:hypothetical protein FF1_042683 [Malus domestica]
MLKLLKIGLLTAVVYSNARSAYSSRKVFNRVKEVDLISANTMISCCAQSGLGRKRACSSLEEGLSASKQIHVHDIKSDIVADTFVSTAPIDVYSRS